MQLMIPEGAQVHIVIGHAAPLALPAPTTPPATASRAGRPLLRGAVVLLLMAGAFAGGHHLAARPAGSDAAQAALADAPTDLAAGAYPGVAAPGLPGPGPGPMIPPDLARQLRAPPTLIPPPGSPPAGATPPPNPFGLQTGAP